MRPATREVMAVILPGSGSTMPSAGNTFSRGAQLHLGGLQVKVADHHLREADGAGGSGDGGRLVVRMSMIFVGGKGGGGEQGEREENPFHDGNQG
jgi:hypothetical protein